MAFFDQMATVVVSEDFQNQNLNLPGNLPEYLTLALEGDPPGPNARAANSRSTAQEILFITTTTNVAMLSFL